MSQEEKELLLKDISARLPYGVKCQVQEDEYTYIGTLCRLEVDNKNGNLLDFVESISGLDCQVSLSEVKPYLFPLSSMTEEQREEFLNIQAEERKILFDALIEYRYGKRDKKPVIAPYKQIEWLNKNHFDYRNLLDKGLAIDATGLNIY